MRLLLTAVAFLLASAAAAQSPLVGTWGGKLPTGGYVLDVALDLRADGDSLLGALDVPTQEVYAIPVRVTAAGDSVRAVAPVGGIVVAGRVAGDTLRGVWTQPGVDIPVVLVRQPPERLPLSALDGTWDGQIAIINQPVSITFEGGDGRVTLDPCCDGAPLTNVRLRGRRLFAAVPDDSARFEGVVLDDVIHGTWQRTQGIYKTTLERAGARADLPYREEEVRVTSRGGVTLAGTLTLPEGDGPFPLAVLVSGTGPQDRDEAALGMRPFAVLADAFARRGIASYRYDDRGVGASTGDFTAATLDDFAADASAAARALAERPDVGAVGIVGHSEGGLIAPEVAVETPEVDFVVALAGASIPGAQVYAAQHERIVEVAGVPAAAAARHRAAIEALVAALVASDAPAESLRPALVEAFETAVAQATPDERAALGYTSPADVTAAATTVADFVLMPGIRSFLTYRPADALASLDVPMLAVFGERDVQIPLDEAEAPMREALARVPGSEVLVLAGKNHFFQDAETGAATEYTSAGAPMGADVAGPVADWILQTAASRAQE